jgi:membrane peptidoglycan carboxypeptidase
VVVAALGPAGVALATDPIPDLNGLSAQNLPQDLLIYDRNGALLADVGNQGDHRIVVPLSAIAPAMVNATVAVEDRTFYTNSGIDFGGLARAAVDDLLQWRFVEGGSTITEQLVKQLYDGPDPSTTVQRKLRDAVLAVALTRHYSKDQILEMYLNTIYFGNQAYGVESAAETYFHTTAARLSLGQATLLAGIPQAPSRYDPVRNPNAARARQAEVLAAMARTGSITEAEARAAEAAPVQVFPAAAVFKATYFVQYVLSILQHQYHITPSSASGYRVVTSLDLSLQAKAESAVRAQIARAGNYYNFHDGALVSMDPKTGEILAMVGGLSNAAGSQINLATAPTRQVGSAFKIFTYTAAIESQKVTMDTPILDEPLVFPIGGPNNGPYAPTNYDGQWHGLVPLKVALGNSLNIPALKVELTTGIPAVLDAARRMGVGSLTQPDDWYGPSLTLGAYPMSVLDMAVGASTLADLGMRHQPAAILQIKDPHGKVVFSADPTQGAAQVVSPPAAYIMAAILSDDQNRCMEFGCNGDLTLPDRQVAAKTGTSEGFHDNWTLGFTPSLTTVVWVGNPNNAPLAHNATGIVGAAPIWHQFMQSALEGTPNEWYAVPSGLDQVDSDYYLPGTEDISTRLDQPWPACPQSSYDPKTTTWSDIQVNGVPCVINHTPDLFGLFDIFR